jgi:PTH1 family peptidyl-tRNA hydrolase
MCVNYFAKAHGIPFDKKKGHARIGVGEVVSVPVVLARPQTYMNASGGAVQELLKKLKAGVEDLIVIHDDLDLPLGRIRIRRGGSSGGHKGIASIIREVGSADFIRVRIGIGRPAGAEDRDSSDKDVIDYVLSGFPPEERRVMDQTLPRVSEAVQSVLTESLAAAMNRYNAAAAEPET